MRYIAENKKGVNGDYISIERAKYILKFRLDTCEDALTKGSGFYPFEEDLPHHINECFVIITSGLGTVFFRTLMCKTFFAALTLDIAHSIQ